jgi:ADP-ribose pyrophosphatase
MELPWQVLATTAVHDTPWRTLYSDHLRLPDGAEIDYSYFTADDAVWLVPVTTEGEIVLIRQYRHPLRDWTLELPAGGADGGSPLAETAARELREEVGGVAGELRRLGSFYGAVAHGSLRRNVFLALDVTLGRPEHEPTERIAILTVPADLAFDMARRGEINDGESALALLYCEQAIREHLARRSS